jgi:cob(I)alamin adenosyltransferase
MVDEIRGNGHTMKQPISEIATAMSDRLTRITTRTGDEGLTSLADGRRVPKTHPRIVALGEVDELNSQIGVLLAHAEGTLAGAVLAQVQHRLFDLGAELAVPGSTKLGEADVTDLDAELQELNAGLPPLREFVLPGGTPAVAHCHLARAVCRRAERALWQLHAAEPVNAASLKFLNRLSDLLFVCARTLARHAGAEEALWQPKARPSS